MPATSTGSSSCPKTTVSPSDLGFASYSDDKTIKIYDVRSNQLLQHYNAHKGPVNEISFHPTGYYMASCSTDAKVKIWDLRKGKALYSLYSHSGSVNSVDFSFAGDYFATGGDDKNLAPGDTVAQTQSAVVLENLIGQFLFNKAAEAGGGDAGGKKP